MNSTRYRLDDAHFTQLDELIEELAAVEANPDPDALHMANRAVQQQTERVSAAR